MEVKVTQWSYF